LEGFHLTFFNKCVLKNLYKLFIRHLNEIVGNFIMVPFLLSLKPVYPSVRTTGNRIRINERGNGI
jgi:hypothetical protein